MADAQVDGIGGWVVDVIGSIGEVGVGLLIALENVVPPIPSEVILPFAGFSAAQGRISLVGAWVAATLGSLVGAWLLYGLGAFIAYERLHGLAAKRWFLLFNTEDLHRGERFFDRHGSKVVLVARFVPLLRSIVSVPAGVVRMPLLRFTGLTALGSGIWNAIFLYAGYTLGGQWERVEGWMGPVSTAVVVLVAIVCALLVVRQVKILT
ncbi:DedA family protein [Actinotalea sp. Marseille-Q4924]|uniref:DedA family protein n=1 Tax=Actinotalea sp. Marseille-Q4924 TaxID=2866571 RepID=UPI001CE464EE|nr:DedA family protein [Actinotalea sp. Marseille-Q4924]